MNGEFTLFQESKYLCGHREIRQSVDRTVQQILAVSLQFRSLFSTPLRNGPVSSLLRICLLYYAQQVPSWASAERERESRMVESAKTWTPSYSPQRCPFDRKVTNGIAMIYRHDGSESPSSISFLQSLRSIVQSVFTTDSLCLPPDVTAEPFVSSYGDHTTKKKRHQDS